MTWAPRAANISPTTDLPAAMPPVKPTLSNAGVLRSQGGQARAPPQFGRLDRVGHQHGDGQGPHATRHGRDRSSHFRRLGMNVAYQRRALRPETLLALGVAGKK